MKKVIAWVLAICMGLLAGYPVLQPACAQSLRHEVTGDVSVVEVDDSTPNPATPLEPGSASVGTEIYLFVDPDTASYVTFVVVDDDGDPVEGAQIYLTYNGVTELYGVTDENGKLSTYLFRNVEYGYTVSKTGYFDTEGTFVATEETEEIRITLREKNTLTVIVRDNGDSVPNAVVFVEGMRAVTDAEGKAVFIVPRGLYSIFVVAPDGRSATRLVSVRGDTTVIIDLHRYVGGVGYGEQSPSDGDGGAGIGAVGEEHFLVYNKDYDPEDYLLTAYAFRAEDVARAAGESREDHAQRTARYLDAHTNTLLIEAQPERIQHDNAPDEDILTPDGKPLYAQRSLMPTGAWLRAWEDREMESLVFTNEQFGVRVNLDALYSGDMAKVYAMFRALERGEDMRGIATEETLAQPDGLARAGLDTVGWQAMDLADVDLRAVRAFTFAYAAQPGAQDVLPDEMFANTLFEVRITPILPEAIRAMLTDGLTGQAEEDGTKMVLASPEYFREQLRRRHADGYLTDTECEELFAFVVDGRLTGEEMDQLRQQAQAGTLGAQTVDLLWRAAMDEKLYRMTFWLRYGNTAVEVSAQIDGLEYIWKADELYAAEYARQLEALRAAEEAAGRSAGGVETRLAQQLETASEQAIEQQHALLTVALDGRSSEAQGFVPGENTQVHAVNLLRSLPKEDAEFYDLLTRKQFARVTVDVRRESGEENGETFAYFRAYASDGVTRLALHRAFAALVERAALAGLATQAQP